MIYWKDFELNTTFGPLLVLDKKDKKDNKEDRKNRETRIGSPHSSVMEDAQSGYTWASHDALIQETGQKQRPARMVGLSSLDSATPRMDAGRDVEHRVQVSRRRGEG